MFDFPASPAVGDVSNGYRWNGTGWAGGPVVGTPTEQVFDVAGKASLDIDVPSWAKGVQLSGVVWPTNASNFAAVQISFDGTTFLAGTNYSMGGPYHNAAASPYYGTQGAAALPCMYLSYTRDNLAMPHNFMGEMNLFATGSNLIALRTHNIAYSAAGGLWNQWFASYYNGTVPNLVKKLRFINYPGDRGFGPASWLRVKWIGSDIPQSNAITEAPADGAEYVRVNGVWREKSRTFRVAGLRAQTIAVPAGAIRVRLTGQLAEATATAHQDNLYMSVDGTTFFSGASDYVVAGPNYNSSGTPGWVNVAEQTLNRVPLGTANNTTGVPVTFDLLMNVARPDGTGNFMGHFTSSTYATNGFNFRWNGFWLNASTSATALKALQIANDVQAWRPESTITAMWDY